MSFTAKHAVIIHLTQDNASVLHCYTQCLSTYLSLVGTVQALVQHATTLPGGPLLNALVEANHLGKPHTCIICTKHLLRLRRAPLGCLGSLAYMQSTFYLTNPGQSQYQGAQLEPRSTRQLHLPCIIWDSITKTCHHLRTPEPLSPS
jgi:hypothetical protein